MTKLMDKLTEEQESIIDELIERVIENGAIELEMEAEVLGTSFRFKMPDQRTTEQAMEEAGRGMQGLRDTYTREALFSRLILSKSLLSVDEYNFDELMARSLFYRLQPGVVQGLFSKMFTQREAQNFIISSSMSRIKKLQPNPDLEQDGK